MDLPSETDRRRERLRVVDVAQTLLSGGMSVRQAADSFHVPTFTLKTWLKEAGIRIEQAAGEREAARITVATAAASTGERLTSEHHPVSLLNEQAQQGRITPLEWQVAATGPSHAPAFTAIVATRLADAGRLVSATGTGASKAVARAAAAAALLGQLTSG
jgi:dsRNA-specific ribonuclease